MKYGCAMWLAILILLVPAVVVWNALTDPQVVDGTHILLGLILFGVGVALFQWGWDNTS